MANAFPKLFYIDSATLKLVIDLDIILGVVEFADLWSKVYRVQGDFDGKNKKHNQLLFMYIVYMDSYASPIVAIRNDEKRHEKALKLLGFPPDWKPDEIVNRARVAYLEIINEYIPDNRTLVTLKQGLMNSSYAIDTYNEQVEIALMAIGKVGSSLKNGAPITTEILADINQANILLRDNIQAMMQFADKLPSVLKKLNDLQDIVMKQEMQAKEIEGGRKKGRREDPKR